MAQQVADEYHPDYPPISLPVDMRLLAQFEREQLNKCKPVGLPHPLMHGLEDKQQRDDER